MSTDFDQAYPAPWRMQGAEIVDAEGKRINGFEVEDPEEVEFWRGIVRAVNSRAMLFELVVAARSATDGPPSPVTIESLVECIVGGSESAIFNGVEPNQLLLDGLELLGALKSAHAAIDGLLAVIIDKDQNFRPTEWSRWPVLVAIAGLLKKHGAM